MAATTVRTATLDNDLLPRQPMFSVRDAIQYVKEGIYGEDSLGFGISSADRKTSNSPRRLEALKHEKTTFAGGLIVAEYCIPG